ncbi:MAG TPA: dTDP-glucose 4,6-dehydratase [Dehalococcoidia bacterium]|nr:dTDP-glucose 4,6-dehydratase [Dehalococcoidia bacterium]
MANTILVTGGCGFIGSHLVRLIRRERPEDKVVVLDNLTYAGNPDNIAEPDGCSPELVIGDVTDAAAVHRIFDSERPDYVVHMAAESHVDRSILEPTCFLNTNVLGTQVMLEAARGFGVKRFLYVSTDEVYGDSGRFGASCTEESPVRASSPYAASKAGADLLVQAYYRTYDMPVVIARPCNHFGPRQFPEKLIPFMLRNLLDGKPLPVYGDGMQERDWLFVEDGARALLTILESGCEGASYNIAAHQERPNIEVITRLCQLFARYNECSSEELLSKQLCFVADRPGHDVRYTLDDERLRRDTQWQPQVAFEEGLDRTVAWYLDNQRWLEEATRRQSPDYYESVYARNWLRS